MDETYINPWVSVQFSTLRRLSGGDVNNTDLQWIIGGLVT